MEIVALCDSLKTEGSLLASLYRFLWLAGSANCHPDAAQPPEPATQHAAAQLHNGRMLYANGLHVGGVCRVLSVEQATGGDVNEGASLIILSL